jgi:hypothetical protein
VAIISGRMTGLDHYLTTEPEERQDDLTPDDDGCRDCGHSPCDCDASCPTCGQPWRSQAEEAAGQCVECQVDYAETAHADYQ